MATAADTISTTAAAATDKLQGMFIDAQGRTRAAMDKSAKFYEDMGEFAKGNVEAVIASSRIAAGGVEAIGQDVAAYGKRSFEQASTTFKSISSIKSPTELFQLHSEFARSAFEAAIAEGSRMSEKMLKLAGEIAQPISSRVAVAAEKMKTPAL